MIFRRRYRMLTMPVAVCDPVKYWATLQHDTAITRPVARPPLLQLPCQNKHVAVGRAPHLDAQPRTATFNTGGRRRLRPLGSVKLYVIVGPKLGLLLLAAVGRAAVLSPKSKAAPYEEVSAVPLQRAWWQNDPGADTGTGEDASLLQGNMTFLLQLAGLKLVVPVLVPLLFVELLAVREAPPNVTRVEEAPHPRQELEKLGLPHGAHWGSVLHPGLPVPANVRLELGEHELHWVP